MCTDPIDFMTIALFGSGCAVLLALAFLVVMAALDDEIVWC